MCHQEHFVNRRPIFELNFHKIKVPGMHTFTQVFFGFIPKDELFKFGSGSLVWAWDLTSFICSLIFETQTNFRFYAIIELSLSLFC